jgi:branched-chain amino acid transport system substrate-binding protein
MRNGTAAPVRKSLSASDRQGSRDAYPNIARRGSTFAMVVADDVQRLIGALLEREDLRQRGSRAWCPIISVESGRTRVALKGSTVAAAAVAVGTTFLLTTASTARQANEQFIPLLVYRTGPYAPTGIPFWNGLNDYFNLINARDDGVGGVKITWEECETAYNNDRGVECYERLKNKGPTGASVVNPYSTGITYALIERASADYIPVLTMGYGRTDASDGRVFPWVFTVPATYWSQATVLIQYVGAELGGMDQLAGKKIALLYHDSAYGKEPIPTLQKLADMYGYELRLFPVAHPGLEQKSTWLQIGRRLKPDYVFVWGWGVMTGTAIKEAVAVGYPMDRMIGNWWSGAEPDVEPAGRAAAGYRSSTFTGPGDKFTVFQDIYDFVYDRGLGDGERAKVGGVYYNRGIVNAAIMVEAIRTAQGKFGARPLTGEEVRWGLENLDLDEARLQELGMTGLTPPLKLSCADHEGTHPIRIQKWDGGQWTPVSDWIMPMKEVVRPMIEASAAQYAKEHGITPRDCSK